jgi:4-methyl-5(b-hydroxyethyl)-thiazole monophosphate biosynthesis
MSTSTNDEKQSKHVLVPIADGSEEIETACITDTLTRFGAKVTVASVKPDQDLVCIMSRGLKVMADCTIDDAAATSELWDMIVLPGGMPGAEHLRDCATLQTLLHSHTVQKQKVCGAICAAPAVVLASLSPSLISQLPQSLPSVTTTATCYPAPAFRTKLAEAGAVISDDNVVVSNNIVTSQGPATALAFSLKLGEVLYGVEKRNEIAAAMLTV